MLKLTMMKYSRFIQVMIGVVFMVSVAFAASNVAFGDQGDNVIYKTNSSFVTGGNLTVLVWDNASGGNLIYNETFLNAIQSGAWNVMLGENQNLSLDYGVVYWKDYLVNGEDVNFVDMSGNQQDRQYWYSPAGEIQAGSLNVTNYWNRSGTGTIVPADFNDAVLINEFLTVGAYTQGFIRANYNQNLTVKGGDGMCFSGDTMVTTEGGFSRIDSLRVGDRIVSFDTGSMASSVSVVVEVTSRVVPSYYILNGVSVTEEHPFYTDSGWKNVIDLVVGSDKLFNGVDWVSVDNKSFVNSSLAVYNLHVSDPYTFFAGGYLVHNKDLAPRVGRDIFVYGGFPYLSSTRGNVYLAYNGSVNVGRVFVGGNMNLFSELHLRDDTGIFFDNSSNRFLIWDSGDQQFRFNGNVLVDGNATADYFIGDGSLLSNLPAGAQYWNRTGTTLITAVDYDNVNLTGNITASFFIGDGSLLTNLNVSFTETDPLWSGNYSAFNDSWSSTYNSTYDAKAGAGNCPAGEFVVNTTSGGVQCAVIVNVTESDPLWSANYSLFNDSWSSTYNATYDAKAGAGNCSFGEVVQNTTSGGVQCVPLTLTESDPLWSGNYSAFNASWSTTYNSTYDAKAGTGNCPLGQFVVNTTTGGVQCVTPSVNNSDLNHALLLNLSWENSGHYINGSVPVNFNSNGTVKTLVYNLTNSRFSFNDNVYANGNVTASYFIGNGSQLTGLPLYWNRTGVTLIPATAGDSVLIDTGTRSVYTDNFLTGNITNYLQLNVKNFNNGTNASSDLVATAGNGDDFNYYVDLGINSNSYNIAAYNITGANDAYLYSQNGSMSIGTASSGKYLIFHTGGTTTNNGRALITDAGFMPYFTNAYDLGNSTLQWRNGVFSGNLSSNTLVVGNATGNTIISASGDLILNGTATVFKSHEMNAYNIYGKLGTYNGQTYAASTLASLGSTLFQNLVATVTGGDVGGAFVFQWVVASDRLAGTNITVRVHYMDAATETCNIVMGVGERHASNGDTYSGADTWNEQTFAVPATQYLKSSRDFSFTGTAIDNKDAIAFTVYRYGEAAADTCSGAIDVSDVDIIYESNRIGADVV